MSQYCVECKFGGQTAGQEIWCNKHQTWMPKYGSCSDWIYWKAHKALRLPFLVTLLMKLGF